MGQIIRPSAISYKDVDLSWMVGRGITHVLFHEPTPWNFSFGPEASIRVECLWRIIEHDRVVLTSEDHGHQFGLPAPVDSVAKSIALLTNRRITAVQLREATADILIKFTGNLQFEVIQDSMGYESWELRDPLGASYFAQGGGQICRWKPCA